MPYNEIPQKMKPCLGDFSEMHIDGRDLTSLSNITAMVVSLQLFFLLKRTRIARVTRSGEDSLEGNDSRSERLFFVPSLYSYFI